MGDHRGFFAGSTAAVEFPPTDLADNATVLAFLGYQIPSTNISFGTPAMKTFTLFAASDNSTVHMSGGFFDLASGEFMTQIITPAVRDTALTPSHASVPLHTVQAIYVRIYLSI